MRHLTPESIDNPIWLEIARRDLGIREGRDDRRIVAMHQHTGLKAQNSKVPWCSSAVCAWFEAAGIRSTRSAAAKSWLKWGQPTYAQPGSVVVLNRANSDAGATGHVGLLVGIEGGQLVLLGGNQGNAVSIKAYPYEQLATGDANSFRWPLVS